MLTLKELMQRGYKTADRYMVSRENKKLVPNDTTAFIIWNLPAKITCPYATDHCKAACYAVKSEVAYPDCLPARMRNLADSRKADFVARMTFTILSIAAGTKKKQIKTAKKLYSAAQNPRSVKKRGIHYGNDTEMVRFQI